MDKIIEFKTIVTAFIISFIGWLFSKFYSYFDVKIRRIDSIEELKKDFSLFKEEYKENHKEIKEDINKLFDKLLK